VGVLQQIEPVLVLVFQIVFSLVNPPYMQDHMNRIWDRGTAGPPLPGGPGGANGAGKTTTISMICGLLNRDAGHVTLQGRTLDTDTIDIKAAIGFVPQEVAIYPDLTARENLRFFGKLYDLSGRRLDERVGRILDTIGLADRGDERTDAFSGGMQRRLNIGLGMLNDPILLVLDEPTVGVDPQSRNAILDSVPAACRQRCDAGRRRGAVCRVGLRCDVLGEAVKLSPTRRRVARR
jgi:ABC-type transport system involved in cytochrome c biogenesis ATPase subunit